MAAADLDAALATVADRLGRSPRDLDQFDTERVFLREFHAVLDSDDVVWVVGARDGLYPLVAATVVGPERVGVVEDAAADREAIRRRLAAAGYGDVAVVAPGALPAGAWTPDGDPGVAPLAGPDEASDLPDAPTVLVLDEPAVGGDLLTRLSVGHVLGVRHMLVKSTDRRIADRLQATGYETTRHRQFDPLRTPWRAVVTAHRDPGLPVTPVPSDLVTEGAAADGPGGLVDWLPLRERLLELPRTVRLVGGGAAVLCVALLTVSGLVWLLRRVADAAPAGAAPDLVGLVESLVGGAGLALGLVPTLLWTVVLIGVIGLAVLMFFYALALVGNAVEVFWTAVTVLVHPLTRPLGLSDTPLAPVVRSGSASPAGPTVRAPLTGTDCLAYEVVVVRDPKYGVDETLVSAADAMPVTVHRGDRRTRVDPGSTTLRLSDDETTTVPADASQVSASMRDVLTFDDGGPRPEVVETDGELRVTERRLDPGDDVTVVARSDSTGELVASRVLDTGVLGTGVALLKTVGVHLGVAAITGLMALWLAVVFGSG